ncbi:MAG: L-seryl-tRNA(Sec) selenium transferase, partial [Halanaerobium sp.]
PSAVKIEIIKSQAKVGGGAYPLSSFDSYALAVDTAEKSTEEFVYKLRQLKTPVIARIQDGKAVFDLKTVADRHLEKLAASITKVLAEVF